tara:strand:- start:372 stop:632 length:261 start_codon:yes stop_codon:yes gene_type:complete
MKQFYKYYNSRLVKLHKESQKDEGLSLESLPYILTKEDLVNYYGNVLSFQDYRGGDLTSDWLEVKEKLEFLLKLCPNYKFFLIDVE